MNEPKVLKPKTRKQLISVLVFMCPSCTSDLVPQTFIENVSGENFIRTKHVCKSGKNCNFEYYE